MSKVKIAKPSIPLVFLDTCFFIDLVENRDKKTKSPYFKDELELADLIVGLVEAKKLLCPMADQDEEYELGKHEEEIRREQVRLSFGISTMHHYGVKRYQTQMAMIAFLKKGREVVYDSTCLFQRDPVKELEEQLSRGLIVTAHLQMPKPYLDKKRKTRKELAVEFEKMRKEKVKMGIKYQAWVKHETLGVLDAIITTLKSVVPKRIQSQPLTQEEINGLQELGDLLAYLSHYSGREAIIKDAADFLKSGYYATAPYISVQSKLYASLLTQSRRVRESDVHDFHQTSQMLPFSTYFLTDSSLKHRITTKPLELDREYGVKVYSLKEIRSLIKELGGL